MLVEEGTSANLEPGPGMSEGVLPGLNGEGIGNLENVDANLGVAIRSTIWYKILFGVLGGILALAVLLKIIGGCIRVKKNDGGAQAYGSFNEKLKDFFILNRDPRGMSLRDGYKKRGAACKLAVTALYDIYTGSATLFLTVKDKISGLPKVEETFKYL